MPDFITIERRDAVALLTFSRPEVLNATTRAMRAEIAQACAEFEADESVRAVVFTGAGARAFGAGADLREAVPTDDAGIDAWVDDWGRFFGAVRELSKPTIAALNGVAAGSSFQFALMLDFRIAHPGVRMGQPEINAGVASSMGPWIIAHALGPMRASDLALTGRLMDAEECRALGLLTQMVAPEAVVESAVALGQGLAATSPLAVRLTKARLRALTDAGFAQTLALWKDFLRATAAERASLQPRS